MPGVIVTLSFLKDLYPSVISVPYSLIPTAPLSSLHASGRSLYPPHPQNLIHLPHFPSDPTFVSGRQSCFPRFHKSKNQFHRSSSISAPSFQQAPPCQRCVIPVQYFFRLLPISFSQHETFHLKLFERLTKVSS
jgi:hypothetical protein